jgi:6-phosphogluconate dehydrogenase
MATQPLFEIGMVGLGVMGRNLVLNMAGHGVSVAGYDKDTRKAFILPQYGHYPMKLGIAGNPKAFVGMLQKPRVVFSLVSPAHVIDAVIDDLAPLLEPGDLLIDAGNSYFKDTDRRAKALTAKGLGFFGMGVSGGESGARHGPSLMPGGPRDAYERVRPVLEAVAAKVGDEPCVAYMGPGSAGHYVKMVHNGIEYGLMQLIAETYDLMKRGLDLDNDALSAVYRGWNERALKSYLLEITSRIFLKEDDRPGGRRLIDLIKGSAGQKGTGKWTTQDTLDLHVPLPTIDVAVMMRDLSGQEAERQAAQEALRVPTSPFHGDRGAFLGQLENALYAASILTYAQGLDLLRQASAAYGYGLNLEEVARIWRGGCIIRAALLEDVRAAYKARPDLPNLVVAPGLAAKLLGAQGDLRAVVRTAADLGLPAAGLMASLAYFDSLRSGWLPTNLIQAQRDFFGAHTYQRTDVEGSFHTEWEAEGGQ